MFIPIVIQELVWTVSKLRGSTIVKGGRIKNTTPLDDRRTANAFTQPQTRFLNYNRYNFFLRFCLFVLMTAGIPAYPMLASNSHVKSAQLTDLTLFLVHYNVENELLAQPLKAALIQALQKIGTVVPGDDSKLTPQEKTEKYETGKPIIDILVSSIIEENLNDPPKYTKLPVIELNINVVTGVEVINNQQKTPCKIWESQLFISSARNQKDLIEAAVKALDSLLDQFITNYKEANPEKKQTPKFYLYL